MTLTDNVVAQVDNTSATSAAGALNLTGTMSGPGGFTKQGDGLATFGTGAKTYAGPTVISGGRIRISSAAQPSATSSFTINAGGQVDLISAGTFTFGNGPLNLNGSGATSGPFAAFPGAIRNDTSLIVTIANARRTADQHPPPHPGHRRHGRDPQPTGSMTFSNVISGPGKLTLTAPNSNIDQGLLILVGANTYAGGTLVQGGILQVTGANAPPRNRQRHRRQHRLPLLDRAPTDRRRRPRRHRQRCHAYPRRRWHGRRRRSELRHPRRRRQ
jgi:autotransporter-associated beta strand protein